MDPREIVRNGYDAIAADYLAARMAKHFDEGLLEELVDRVPRGAKVLDAGCGAGIPVTRFLSRYFDVIGVDLSQRQIDLAMTAVPSARFVRHDLTKLGLDDESFDAITCFYTIFHIEKDKQASVIENFYRLLKPGGLLMICFSGSDHEHEGQEEFFGVPMYYAGFGNEKNRAIITDAGFEIVRDEVVQDPLDDASKQLFVLAKKKEAKN